MILEPGHSPDRIEGKAQVGDLQLQFLHPAKGRDVPASQAEKPAPFDESKSECPSVSAMVRFRTAIVEQSAAASTEGDKQQDAEQNPSELVSRGT